MRGRLFLSLAFALALFHGTGPRVWSAVLAMQSVSVSIMWRVGTGGGEVGKR
jgi:hypothetical protein